MTSAIAPSRPMWATATRVLLGLLPLWILLFEFVAVPGFLDPLGAVPPAIAGLPAGLLIVGAALLVMALGVLVLWRSSPVIALLGFVCLTLPATFTVIMGPVVVILLMSRLWGM